MPTLEKKYEPSHIRRGRLSTSPTWYVNTDAGGRWQFYRKRDAQAFISRGCMCDEHLCGPVSICRSCNGRYVSG